VLFNLVEQLLNALALAGLLFLVSAGLSLVFGILRVVNFAHGVFYMLGAYLGYTTVAVSGPSRPPENTQAPASRSSFWKASTSFMIASSSSGVGGVASAGV